MQINGEIPLLLTSIYLFRYIESCTSGAFVSGLKGSIGHAFAVRIRTGNQNQADFSPFSLREISVLFELTVGHLRYRLTDVPPQPNSPPDSVFHVDQHQRCLKSKTSKEVSK